MIEKNLRTYINSQCEIIDYNFMWIQFKKKLPLVIPL